MYVVQQLVARRGQYILILWEGNWPLSWVHRDALAADGPMTRRRGWFERIPQYVPAMGIFEGHPENDT